MTNISQKISDALEAGQGILHLAPNWVPRSFLMPGKRIRLAGEDLYVLGADRGGIDERWFASTTKADNGPGTPEDEGLSYVVGPDGKTFLLAHAVEAAGADLIGQEMMRDWGRWPLYCKFFDNMGPIPHHLHQLNEHVQPIGREHKPEAYYFPPQYNPVGNNFPYTFFGLEPGTTKADLYRCLERWNEGDNGILDLSKAYRLKPGTGWLVPPGILHAPGSLCTYEVQWGSDVFAMYQSLVEGRVVPWDLLVKDVPEDKRFDLDYIVSMVDWEPNVTTTFKDDHYLEPIPVGDTSGEGYQDRWVIYGKVHGEDLFAAKELSLQPGIEVTIKDQGASGAILVQGRGKLGTFDAETPSYIRYGEITTDEYFISDARAKEGYTVTNTGQEPLVILRYFGPGVNAEMPEIGSYKRQG
ncbi:MAG: hypothetical protein JSV66_06665 [Trueperaceae bacterium]|nr:MAG: hypothetical protein JSV66_06665 [Trueperaceae bacterium]